MTRRRSALPTVLPVALDTVGPKEIPDTLQGDSVNAWTYLARKGYDPAPMREGTKAHETRGHNDRNGHHGQFEKAMSTRACGAAASLLERVVAGKEAEAKKLMEAIETNARRAFFAAGHHYHVFGNVNAEPYVVRDPTPDTFFVATRWDARRPKRAVSPEEKTWCDWTNF